ncbi:lectin [Lysobacter silvisoli]|uniref:Lectin n=1 Tax=Lysobacter silvisoli TaxID=2293254 RepID=A0A371K105_9GAMM|nr:lectin [Lysobacter silvisoli]RDZ27578.1 lectin [Lysobacter silvisoli]
MRPWLLTFPVLLALAACGERAPAPAGPTAADPPPASSPPADQPPEDVPPATAPAPLQPVAGAMTRMDGYGDLRLGMSTDEAKQAWGGELNGKPSDDPAACYYLWPKSAKLPRDFALMIEAGKFVRYDVGTANEAAPGGGKVGMDEAALRALYRDGLEETPHKYVEGGKVLSIAASGVAPSKLVFELDAAGKVTAWRVGLLPQADYVEGCS